jgi:mono/diheme cytochrome c family protein
MRRIIIRGSAALAGLALLFTAGLAAVVESRWDRTFDVAMPDIRASSDPDLIERGRYLVFGPAHCAYCHSPKQNWSRLDGGEELPLSGGYGIRLPIGTVYASNLTPDSATGIGRVTDGQIARMLRHNVRADGRAALPLMEFGDMSDEDVAAIISYLRTVRPVRNPVPEHELTRTGRAVMAMVVKPASPDRPARAVSPAPTADIARGEYLANAVANCAGCHSPRNLADGSYTGARFSGGVMDVDGDPDHFFAVPNLTPDPVTGHLTGWSEEMFLARFRFGIKPRGSHMPWGAYRRMSDDDLRAVYRYLMSLEPVPNATGPLIQAKRER